MTEPRKISIAPSPSIELVTLDAAASPDRWLAIAQRESATPDTHMPDLVVIDEEIEEARVFGGGRHRSGAEILVRAAQWVMQGGRTERRRDRLDDDGMFVSSPEGEFYYLHDCGETVMFGDADGLIACLRLVQLCKPYSRDTDLWKLSEEIRRQAGLGDPSHY